MLEAQIHDTWGLEVTLIPSILEYAEGEENRAELRDLRSSETWGARHRAEEAKREGNQEKPTEKLKESLLAD